MVSSRKCLNFFVMSNCKSYSFQTTWDQDQMLKFKKKCRRILSNTIFKFKKGFWAQSKKLKAEFSTGLQNFVLRLFLQRK